MKIGNKYNVIITDNDSNGNGIARIDNFVVFIPYTLKNENVEIEITNVNKRFANAKIIKINKKSNKRCNVKCTSYDRCGGCTFLHTNIDYENKLKIDEINKLFNISLDKIISKNEYNYRNKATFHVKDNKIGY